MGSLAISSRENEKMKETCINLLRSCSFKNRDPDRVQINSRLQNVDGFGLFKAHSYLVSSSAHSCDNPGTDSIYVAGGQFLLLLL